MQHSAFTLIEVMVALAIFATIAVLSVMGVRSLIDFQTTQTTHNQQLADLQVAYTLMSRDLQQAVNRPIRNEMDELEAAFIGNPMDGRQRQGEQVLWTLTRQGNQNPGGISQRSELVRVSYLIHDEQLIRLVWQELERDKNTLAEETVLLPHFSRAAVSYLDAESSHQDSWLWLYPLADIPLSDMANYSRHPNLPAAIELHFELAGLGEMTWYWLLPGGRRDED